KGKIEFRNVTFQFKDADSPTLQNINFVSKPGQVTAIIGSTGSGKSSIINLIPRFYDVTEGQVLIDDVDVRDFSQKDLREKIGFVPQQALLFSGSVADNLRYGRQNADEALMWEALNVAQAAKFVGRKEEKLEFDVSQGGKNFSGGQKQRISIARALIKKPEIYIFDDAFSALDFKTDIKLRQALKSYVKQATVIIVAQRVSTIIDSDNILVLHEGKIVAQGKHEALLHKCKIYREIVYSQLDPEEIDKTLALSQQVLATNEGAD
ncbi:MAG TPA: multidrug ABC transporter ATP-binding protein, partial [Firmicutes bacterium]|nr:multidrug ABC transporter ATP-binding protein [Bacillota bacterium]